MGKKFCVESQKAPMYLKFWAGLSMMMTSYQYMKSHCGDKTILRPYYLHNGISYTGKMTSFYWIGAMIFIQHWNFKSSRDEELVLILETTPGFLADYIIIKTHVRGFFNTDLHEVSWHFATHEAVRPSGF